MSLSPQYPCRFALLFPGQGAQHARMAAGLYGHDQVFTDVMDRAFTLLGTEGRAVRSEWLRPVASRLFDDVTVAQPLLYAVNVALGSVVLGWGGAPVALLGHSVGEFAAATLGGVVDFDAGIRLMRERMTHFAVTPAGGMLAVAATVEDIEPLLHEGVFLAAVNSPRQLLLAGERKPLSDIATTLDRHGIINRAVSARQAFHSPVVAGAVTASLPGWQNVTLRPSAITLYSAYTQSVLSDERAVDPGFWAGQAASTVYFGPTLNRMLHDHDCVVVEAGPGRSLTALARRHAAVRSGRSRAIALLPSRHASDEADRDSVASAKTLLTNFGLGSGRDTALAR
ncbi:acyltransferase domain-containing protein [Nocardia sp. NPDC046473]|uniref:acyltransferase domain-containing protein n=1 Tax=Nocardia sp. NPDC046473 TaxID=3155733 RepID=UPI0033DDBCA9